MEEEKNREKENNFVVEEKNMSVPTADIQLYETLRLKLGNEEAAALVSFVDIKINEQHTRNLEMLSTRKDIDELKVACKKDIDELRVATKKDMDELRIANKKDIDELRVATKKDIDELRIANKEDIDELRTATKKDIDELRIATKKDMEELRTATKKDLDELRIANKNDINDLKFTTRVDIDELKVEIKNLELSIKDQISGLVQYIEKKTSETNRWVFGMFFAFTMVLVACFIRR